MFLQTTRLVMQGVLLLSLLSSSLNLHTLHDRISHFDVFFYFCFFRFKYCPPVLILLVFKFFLLVSETPPSLVILVKTFRLLDVFRLLTLSAKTSISVRNALTHYNIFFTNLRQCLINSSILFKV
jgi:hypothetical protein